MEFLTADVLGKPLWMWLGFLALVTALLAFDLGVLHRKSHEIGVKESLLLSAFYIGVGLLYSIVVWQVVDATAATQYLTGFVVEKSLAMDNIFVIATIFAYFSIPRAYQHRVLVYGIIGVIVLRAIMIGLGATIVSEFEWVLYIFAAFLVFTGVKMLFAKDEGYDVANNPVLKFLSRRMRVTNELHGERFFVRKPDATGKVALFATPLFLALVVVEFADVIFAVDSIPAIFAITTDPYVVYTSNIFAILGLRALYFALAAMIHRFAYLQTALALVLVFIGGKVFAAGLLGMEKIPPEVSLGVTVTILVGGVVFSLWKTRNEADTEPTLVEAASHGGTRRTDAA
jgi:tellurite resistance protein TerC